MERLARQVQETQKQLSFPETDWKYHSSAIDELATAVEALGPSTSRKDAARLLLSLSGKISALLVSHRSKLVKDTCEGLLRIVQEIGRDFQDMANALLPQIVCTAKNSSAAIRQPGSKLLCKMSEVVRYDLSLLKKIYMPLMHAKASVLVLEQLGIMFVYWTDSEVLPFESDVLAMIQRGLEDQNEKVRKTAREVLARFSSRWSERVEDLVEIPSSQAKALIVSEHRDSPLAEAILKEYPELDKSDSLLRSRSSFTQSRASSRKSPRHKREQDVEIRVSKTPPPKERELQDGATNSGVATSTNTRRSAKSPESTSRDQSAVSRRLFDKLDVSEGRDDDQQEDTLQAFDGSQMHKFYSTLAEAETVLPPASEIENILSPTPAIQSRTRSSSTSSVERASLRHPGAQKLQETKIPSPLSRSPSFLRKNSLESSSSATSSPKLRPSLLARPGSFTLQARGSSGPSTPVGSAKFEEEKADTIPLSASDEYFSKPIPSSIASLIPPPPSTDNVTLRSRRRMFVHQDEELYAPLQTYTPEMSSLDLAASEEYIQPQEEDKLESVVNTSPVGYGVASSLDEELYTDEADVIGHLTEGSDHVESDTEWKHRRLDYSDRSGSEEEGSHLKASFVAKSDAFPDEWHLDDGARHKFGFKDEIGDHLSDEEQDQAEDFGGVEVEHSPVMDMSERSQWTSLQNVESSRPQYFTVQSDCREEEDAEHEELITEIIPSDALAGLLNVREEMGRLREKTRSEETVHNLPFTAQHATAKKSQDSSPATEKRSKEELSYFERLTRADQFARSPQIVPPDAPHDETRERIEQNVQLQTFESALGRASSDDEHEQTDDDVFLALPPRPTTVKKDEPNAEPFDFAKEPQTAESCSPRSESNANTRIQAIVQRQESYIAHDDHAGRFDAAEKLFAAEEVRDYYGRPQSPHEHCMAPKQERYVQSQPSYPAPTRMGAMPAPANERNVGTEDVGDAPKATPAEYVTKTDDPVEKEAPKRALERMDEETAPQPAEFMVPATTEDKHGISAAPVKTPPKATPERNPPTVKLSWMYSFGISLIMLLSAIFCISGILYAAKKVSESHEYHLDLRERIGRFESSIAESHKKVLQLEKDYAVWSEYVRKLTEEDEANALTQLQALHVEVQKWQQDMHEDLVQFRQALSVDSIEQAFANVRVNDTKQIEE
ncbi:hypothetical protein PInf_014598 [Phytophthora infestans]|nr:hypothetical protein PInf_014598 [Phytophthora infestans]